MRGAAAARGIEPARLVFALRLDLYEEHLARHRLADLFLDTLPYNAHATASDALWAGLPLLTCRGASFAGRVATSLLDAAGLPELVTDDLGAYEALALRLATDAALLRRLPAAPRAKPGNLPVVRYRPVPPPYRARLHDDVGAATARRAPGNLQRRAGAVIAARAIW